MMIQNLETNGNKRLLAGLKIDPKFFLGSQSHKRRYMSGAQKRPQKFHPVKNSSATAMWFTILPWEPLRLALKRISVVGKLTSPSAVLLCDRFAQKSIQNLAKGSSKGLSKGLPECSHKGSPEWSSGL